MIKSSALFLVLLTLFCCQLYGQNTFSWKAGWITAATVEEIHGACPIFRKELVLAKPVQTARLSITAHGLYEAQVNGQLVTRDLFTPGFTSYHHRLLYQVYEIDSLLHPGNNPIEVTIGDGWYRGKFGPDMKEDRYGKDASLLFQLDIVYRDGSQDHILSDTSWKVGTGPILSSDIYNGELTDQRIRPGTWSAVKPIDGQMDKLVESTSPAVRRHELFPPIDMLSTPKGERVLDFGQNMAGWVQVQVEGKAGDTVRLAYGESLDKDSNFYTGNLRRAKAEDVYILRGGKESLEPHFTYHGFRFVKVISYPGPIVLNNFRAVALYSDLEPTGSFLCSDPRLNRLQLNITWSQKSNFFDIPTDCPQRSERFGWTGDAQVFCRTAAFNQDVKAFYAKWLADLAAEQGSNGGLSAIVPDFRRPDTTGTRGGVAGWGDAATIIPWTLFEVYGDTAVLRAQYNSMKAWVEFIHHSAAENNGLWTADGYGDWYAPLGPTELPFIDECFFFHSTDLLIKAAKVLGKNEDVAVYQELREQIRKVFLQIYGGEKFPNTQTANVLALQFDILPEEQRPAAIRRLVDLIHANQDHLATGFLGTPYLLLVLTRYGHNDLAYTLLEQTSPPSWLYPLSKGATTIWEKWTAIKPDGSFDTCSLNHYAYGAVGEWMYRVAAGIDLGEPGYKKILIQPVIGGGLSWVKASYKCPYGLIVSNWKLKGTKLEMKVTIPKNTTARVVLPKAGGAEIKEVGPGSYRWSFQAEITSSSSR